MIYSSGPTIRCVRNSLLSFSSVTSSTKKMSEFLICWQRSIHVTKHSNVFFSINIERDHQFRVTAFCNIYYRVFSEHRLAAGLLRTVSVSGERFSCSTKAFENSRTQGFSTFFGDYGRLWRRGRAIRLMKKNSTVAYIKNKMRRVNNPTAFYFRARILRFLFIET